MALLSAAASLALIFAPASAGAATLPAKKSGKLSPLLQRLSGPALRDASPTRQAKALGVAASGPGSLLRVDGHVIVETRFDHGAIASRDEVREAGGQVLGASRREQTATVAVAPADLKAVAAVPTVASVQPVRTPLVFAAECEGGSVISEGVAQLQAQAAREEFGAEGEGVTVGVLSDSFDQATEGGDGTEIATRAETDEETADLPGAPRNTCPGQEAKVQLVGPDLESSEATDEGRAMLQIVHDVAPKASLSFATAFGSEEAFAKSIEELAEAGAEVIVDDVAYFEEPFFQEGPVAVAIRKVTEGGVAYFSAAGNDNLFDGEGNEIASWEAPEFRDAGGCPAAVSSLKGANGSHCLDFNPSAATDRTFGVKVKAGATLTADLQWAEPRFGVETDLDAFLLSAGGALLAGSVEDNPASGKPVEIVQWTNTSSSEKTVQLVVNRYSGPGARLKLALMQNGGGVSGTEYPVSGGGDVVGPTVFGHAGAASAVAVGAVPVPVSPFNATPVERYSSRGPVTNYFGPVEGSTPAASLAEPEVISKPDLLAPDCGANTFFGYPYGGSTWRFCGTSAAAPHAAGVAALLRGVEPAATSAQIVAAMTGTGAAVASFGPCVAGGGLVDALAAGEALKGEGSIVPPGTCAPPDASGGVFVAAGEWGVETTPAPTISAPTSPAPSTEEPEAALSRPATRILKHPRRVVRTRRLPVRLRFRFGSNQAGVRYRCRIDGGRFHRCRVRLVHRFGRGRHVVRVKARGATGLVDRTPAVFRFRVVRAR